MSLTLKNLAPSEEDIILAEKLGIKYKKYQKNDFKKMRAISLPCEESINNLENLFGKIPVSYLNFLKKYNGGIPTQNLITLPNGDMAVIGGFLLSSGNIDIYSSIENYAKIFNARIPKNCMPIGFTPGGDLFLIETNSQNSEAVLYWKHDDESDQFSFKNIMAIANSFSEFLSKLTDIEK